MAVNGRAVNAAGCSWRAVHVSGAHIPDNGRSGAEATDAGGQLAGRPAARPVRPSAAHGILARPVLPLDPRRCSWSRRDAARLAGLLVAAAVALLALGRVLVASAPVSVEIVGAGRLLTVTADGTTQQVELPAPVQRVQPVRPIRYRREHQIDGSDSTNTFTFSAAYFAGLADSPYYQFQAWLREEWRYSVWRRLVVYDATGQVVIEEEWPRDEESLPLPDPFRLTIALERPEIPRQVALTDATGRSYLLEVNRNDKLIRLGIGGLGDGADLAAWYFPRDWRPPLATLADLLIRAVALALALLLATTLLAAVLPAGLRWRPGWVTARVAVPLGLAWLLAASAYGAVVLFDRAPHVLDAVSYVFQAKTFAAGLLSAPPPLVQEAFPVPFAVEWQGRWFSQYPPGTAALLALGFWAGLPWLVEPLLAVAAALLTFRAAEGQYGHATALLTLLLLISSPFLILQSGLFLSHVPALFFGTVVLYAATRYAERPAPGWAALIGAGLGLLLLTREIVAALYGVGLVAVALGSGLPSRGRAGALDVGVLGLLGLGGLLLYAAYNTALTGVPYLLPRHLFNSQDVYGFGSGIGFYGEHSVASGLVNAEQQLTSLTFWLAGWPFGFSLGLPLLPFLTRRWHGWDRAHGALVLLFVLAYVGYFYHGIVLGPRYLLEAVPSLAILTARGFVVLTESVSGWLARLGRRHAWWRARLAALLLLAALLACNAVYFLPRQVTLYQGFSGLPGGGPTLDQTVGRDLAGRTPLLENALVVTDEWWYQVLYFAALNCPRLDCPTVYAYGPDAETRALLRARFPRRHWYDVHERDGILRVEPGAP